MLANSCARRGCVATFTSYAFLRILAERFCLMETKFPIKQKTPLKKIKGVYRSHEFQRDAKYIPQAFAFRPTGNSPSNRHLTHIFLLCFLIFLDCTILMHLGQLVLYSFNNRLPIHSIFQYTKHYNFGIIHHKKDKICITRFHKYV